MTRAGGVVLAGGRSTRMGAPKAELDWHGRPLVVHVAVTLRDALGGGPVVVVAAPGQPLPAFPAGCAVTHDPAEGRGPLQGLIAGLAALEGKADAAVVVATDQPGVAAAAAPLLAGLRTNDDAVAFAGQPLGALYRTALRTTAERRLAAGEDTSLRGLLAAVRTRTLEPNRAMTAALRSLDTPAAYAAALARASTAGSC